MDLISIVVPVYNAEKYLRKCVDSLVNQTYENLEILLIDDGSKDSSGKICDEYADKYPNKVRVIHNENQGPSATRNCGIAAATGKYLVFSDSDDWLEADIVEKMYEAISEYPIDLVYCGYARFQDGKDVDSSTHQITTFSTAILTQEEVAMLFTKPATSLAGVSIWAKMYRLDIIKENNISFPLDIHYEEDCVFNLMYYRHVKKAAALPNIGYHYRQNEESLSKGFKSTAYQFLVNGYRERVKFFEELGLQSKNSSLNVILMMVIVNNCKKIAMADLTKEQKIAEYTKMLEFPETKKVAGNGVHSKVKLTKAIATHIKSDNATAIHGEMEKWKKNETNTGLVAKSKRLIKKIVKR